ncbi:MAG: hypothetical protein IKP14_00785 [Clostridiales bacterium]|nr:hypothetical protein [Clostridiales bacterium]
MRTTDTLTTGPKLKDVEVTITRGNFFTASLIYLTLPVIIFFFGYLKIVWALLFSVLTITALVFAIKRFKQEGPGDQADKITLKPSYFAVVIPLIIVFLFLGGVSEYSWTTIDHRVRYAILNDLINYKWPVIFDFSTQENPIVAAQLGEGKVAFAYYFVFWMVPAVIGKLTNLAVARVALFIWSGIGLFLVSLGGSFLYKKASKTMFIAIMFFSGFDVIPGYINDFLHIESTWEGWNIHLHIHGNFYQIMNVFNQSIPGWLITMLLMLCLSGSCVGLLGSLMFCYSPWAAIGFAPLCLCRLLMNKTKENRKTIITDLITPGNLIAPVVFIIVFATYFTANSQATSGNGLIWKFYDTPMELIIDYVKYAVFEFGIWALIIFKRHKKDPLFWTSIATLLIMPIYKITIANDFIMRGSMAPMFLIGIYVSIFITDNFYRCLNDKGFVLKTRAAVLTLIVAAYVPINLLITSAVMTYEIKVNKGHLEDDCTHDIDSFGNINHEDQLDMVKTQFYVYNYEDTIFFKYLAK